MSKKDDISKGKFSFVTENYDTFEICFISRVPLRKYIKHEAIFVFEVIYSF